MAWLSLRVEVERAVADALSDALIEAGAQSVAVDSPDGPTNVLNALFHEQADPDLALTAATRASGVQVRARLGIDRVADEDWVRSSQAQFAPFRVGRLWVGATWHTAPSDAAAILRIDPGLAFGTGSHPTTRLVLEFLECFLNGGDRVLDYGCGSGILAIAAAKLGARRIDAVDIDPQAVQVTEANARANRVALRASLPDGLHADRYDLVVANILALPLIELAPELSARTRPGGRLALSGILDSQAEEVRSAYAPAFDMVIGEQEEGWALVHGVRR
jgi:ribosomal protein L11 methyltransferase